MKKRDDGEFPSCLSPRRRQRSRGRRRCGNLEVAMVMESGLGVAAALGRWNGKAGRAKLKLTRSVCVMLVIPAAVVAKRRGGSWKTRR